MLGTETIPAKCIWLKPEQMGIQAGEELTKAIEAGETVPPIIVYRDPKLNFGHYAILRGVDTFLAMRKVGKVHVECVVQNDKSFFQDLRSIEDPIAWGAVAAKFLAEGYITAEIIRNSHLPRSVVLDRIEMHKRLTEKESADKRRLTSRLIDAGKLTGDVILHARACKALLDDFPELTISKIAVDHNLEVRIVEDRLEMLEQVEAAERHGKVLGRQEKIVDDNESNILERIAAKQAEALPKCQGCKRIINRINFNKGDGLCSRCAKSPQERGMAKCLEPACPKWIKHPMRRVLPLQAAYYFCKEHQKHTSNKQTHEFLIESNTQLRNVSNMPEHDRDGDPIWITREVEVLKIKLLEDSHLTNCLTFMEAAAKRRCQVTGVDESKWLEVVGPRYKHMVTEAKRRDERLKCVCKDGLISTTTETSSAALGLVSNTKVVEVFCKDCQLGKGRQLAREMAVSIAEERKGKKAMSLKVAMVMIVSLIVGGQLPAGSHIVAWLIEHLRAFGVVR